MIQRRVERSGDGTHPLSKKVDAIDEHHHPENPVWGWNDTDMSEDDRKLALIAHQKSD